MVGRSLCALLSRRLRPARIDSPFNHGWTLDLIDDGHVDEAAIGLERTKIPAVATDKMRVRLYWQDGRVEQLKGEVDAGTTHIVRQTPQGHCHFDFAEEIDDEGYAIFWQEEDEQP